MIDGRPRIVHYTLNSDNTVTAVLPHFWEYAGMPCLSFIPFFSFINLLI